MAHPKRYLWVILLPTLWVRADTPSEDDDVRILQSAHLQPDGQGAIRYFRQRAVGTADQQEILSLVRKLGDDTYAVRERATEELISRGLPAIAPLRVAKTDTDVEVARRAERCLKAIEEVPAASISAAAARMIARRKPDGGAEALLAFLPVADDEIVADEMRDALAALAMSEGKPNPVLVQGLDSKEAIVRGAAGEALIRAGDSSARRLFDDSDPDVRFRVVLAAVQTQKDKSAVPNLIKLLADGPANKAWRVEEVLLRLADDSAPQVSLGRDEAGRGKCRDAWNEWWTANLQKVDLAKLDQVPESLGLTMVLLNDNETGTGRVFEVNSKKEEQWSISDLKMPQDAVVVGKDRVLIAEFGTSRGRRAMQGQVVMRDFQGKEIWKKDVAMPMCVQALPQGHFLIAARNQIIEFDENQKEVFTSQRAQHDIRYAAKDRNGDYVMMTYNQIIRLKPDKPQQAISIPQDGRTGTLELLPHNRFLITQQLNGVAEYDMDGKVVWSNRTPSQPTSAQKLPNGNILVTSSGDRTVIEMDRQNKVVWKYKPLDQKAGDNSLPLRARRR